MMHGTEVVPTQNRHYAMACHGIERPYLRSLGVVDVNWIAPARDSEDGGMIKELAEVLGVQCGGGDEQLEVWSEAGQILDKAKQDVCMKRALMSFINHHHTASKERGNCELLHVAEHTETFALFLYQTHSCSWIKNSTCEVWWLFTIPLPDCEMQLGLAR